MKKFSSPSNANECLLDCHFISIHCNSLIDCIPILFFVNRFHNELVILEMHLSLYGNIIISFDQYHHLRSTKLRPLILLGFCLILLLSSIYLAPLIKLLISNPYKASLWHSNWGKYACMATNHNDISNLYYHISTIHFLLV